MAEGLLSGRVALVTGAASGIGAGIADLFARHGAHVFILDVNVAGAKATADAIQASGGSAFWFDADVRRPESLAPVVEAALTRFGRIDALINNAGVYPRRSFLEMTAEQWDAIQDVNVKGIFHATKLVLPHMVRRRSGYIVNISSVTFLRGSTNLTHYIASKGAVIGFTRALAREMGEHNIHVNAITPGAVEVEAEKALATQEQLDAIVVQQCLQRRIVPLDIANVCLFLCCGLGDGMTGQTLNVDGGWAMY